jgi:hypothetical protein
MADLVNLTYQIKLRIQQLLTKVGSRTSAGQIQRLNSILNYIEVGRWLRAQGYTTSVRYKDRWLMYEALARDIKDERVVYLEFGVYEGYTLRRWAKLLQHQETRLFGFDSFQGLPEDWDSLRPQGTFDVKGVIPTYDDPRVSLCQGWFSETLPSFTLPDHDRLVLHLDADLYSSTKFVLERLNENILPGTIIIFDQFCDRMNELRAWDEFVRRTRKEFRFAGGTINLEQVAFQCCG